MYITLAVVSGGLIAVMVLVNGSLQSSAGALPALLFIHLTGLTTSAVYLALTSKRPRLQKGAPDGTTPFWFIFAGVLGIGVVFLNNLVFSKGGVLLTLGGTLAGQTLFAHLLEGTRWFDGRRSPTPQRVLSLALVLPGAAIIGLRSGVGIGWTLLSWLPGALLMVASMMNARNAIRWGQSRMIFFNYASALVVLIPLFALAGGVLAGESFALGGQPFGSWAALAGLTRRTPLYLLFVGGMIGVVVVGTTIFLFNRASALKVVLGLYAGQIAVGIVLDSVSGRPLQLVKVAGVVMVIIGLAAGEIPRMRRPRRDPRDAIRRFR